MAVTRKCRNGRYLLVSDWEAAISDIDKSGRIPEVTLLTAWDHEFVSPALLRPLILQLVARGCLYFVCAGHCAEALHDLVDDVIDLAAPCERPATTFHNDDTAEDVVNFFVHTTTIRNNSSGGLVAVLRKNFPDDNLIYSLLLKE